MGDRLVSLLKLFELEARVYQAGPMAGAGSYLAADGLGRIHVLRSGVIRVETGGSPDVLQLDRPSLIFYLAPTDHRLVPVSTDTDLVCASIEFGAGLNNPLVAALPDCVVVPLLDLPNIGATLDVLFREASEDHCGRQAILDRMAEVLIIQLLRELMDQGRIEFGLMAGLADARLSKALNAMHADPGRNWGLEALASTASMSRAAFANRFRDIVGCTPMAYLSQWRLSAARTLLRRGKSVQQTAAEVGYGSASALSRAFTAHNGLSPREWLQQQWSE